MPSLCECPPHCYCKAHACRNRINIDVDVNVRVRDEDPIIDRFLAELQARQNPALRRPEDDDEAELERLIQERERLTERIRQLDEEIVARAQLLRLRR